MDNRDPTDRAGRPAEQARAPANGVEPLDLGAAVARARQAGLKSAELVQYIGEYSRRVGAW